MNDLESRIVSLTRANQRWKILALCLLVGVGLFAANSFARAAGDASRNACDGVTGGRCCRTSSRLGRTTLSQ